MLLPIALPYIFQEKTPKLSQKSGITIHLSGLYPLDCPGKKASTQTRLNAFIEEKKRVSIYFSKIIFKNIRGSGSSVGMIMVQFEDSLRQRSESQISIRSSYSEKIFYEKKKNR